MTAWPIEFSQDASRRQKFGGYDDSIFKADRLVARYWHGYRDDEHEIEVVDGHSQNWLVGRMADFHGCPIGCCFARPREDGMPKAFHRWNAVIRSRSPDPFTVKR